MPQDLDFKRERGPGEAPRLDHGKLVGFRNLAAVTKTGSDVQAAADLAFKKRADTENPEAN